MKILFISHKYPPSIGGMEKQCYELIRGVEKEHEVYKVVYDSEYENRVQFFFRLKKRVKKILREQPDIDIIHLNDGLMAYFGLWLQTYTSIPVVVTYHGLDVVFPNSIYQRKIIPKYHHYEGGICVSTATAQACTERDFPSEKIHVVPNGVDSEIADLQLNVNEFVAEFQEKHNINLLEKKIIISLGRPVKRKGFSWFIKEVVPQLDKDVLYIIVGPSKQDFYVPLWRKILPQKWLDEIDLFLGASSDEQGIFELLQKNEFKNRVLQTGALPYEKMMALLTLADIFVMPNIKVEGDAEGFGLVALEATLRKTPVLASGIEGITEAIKDGKNGYLLPSENAEVWVKKIDELLKNPNELRRRGEEFQQYTLANYSWEKMARGYIEVFEKITSPQPSPARRGSMGLTDDLE